ncbi:DUF1295 domain-containing protein [Pseudonocardiaceae bacterium YIM PH 21723]|nr:DUF1295 domain-containing protein [Pseudonocardiaceae bacterium YIM PH 21723]
MFGWNLLITALTVAVMMAAALGIAQRRGRHDGIDVLWGLGFPVIALVTLAVSDGNIDRRLLITALTVIWGVRLAVHIGRRNHGKPEDPRYQEIVGRKPGSTWHVVKSIYLPQALVMWFVSLPVQAAQYSDGSLGALDLIGALLWVVGFGFEAIGDHQLQQFRDDPSSKGKVLDTGLWRYTRHPNYFGDATLWWGLYLIAAQSWLGAAMILSPIVMTWFLAKGTGKPLLEKSLHSSRPGYADYVARTSGFFPLPPKKTV